MCQDYLRAALSLAFVALAGTGMSGSAQGVASKVDAEPSLATVENLIRVPLVRQATDYTCGVAAFQSVLAYYGEESREDKLAKALGSDQKEGTDYRQIAQFARDRGYTVEIMTGMGLADLKRLLDQRKPVICLIQAWPDKPVAFAEDWVDGHYVVAVGYCQQSIYFMDPSTIGNYTQIPIAEFLERWHDTSSKERLVHFGMVITKGEPKYNPSAILPLK